MAVQQPSMVSRRVDEGTRKGRFLINAQSAAASNLGSDDSVGDEPSTVESERVRADSHVAPLATQMATNQEALASLRKLQEEFTSFTHHHNTFRETWNNIEEHVKACGLEDAQCSPPMPFGHHDDLVGMVGTVGPLPQQATRPNTPTSTSAYSTSSCTSRTPPATSCSDHWSGHRSLRTSAETHHSNHAGDNREKRESTLRMWSDLGDTLQEVVQRNNKLEKENDRLQKELESVEKQVSHLKQELLELEGSGETSSSSGYQAADFSSLDCTLQAQGAELWHQQAPPPTVQVVPPQIQNTQPQAGALEPTRGRFRFSQEVGQSTPADEARVHSPEDDGPPTVRQMNPHMEDGRLQLLSEPVVQHGMELQLHEGLRPSEPNLDAPPSVMSPSPQQVSMIGLGAADRPVEEASLHPQPSEPS